MSTSPISSVSALSDTMNSHGIRSTTRATTWLGVMLITVSARGRIS